MDKYTFRFSQEAYNDLGAALEYWMVIHSTSSIEEYINHILKGFELPCLYPEMMQVTENLEDGRSYRRVNVWLYAFLYRIDEEQKELVIDVIYHVRSNR